VCRKHRRRLWRGRHAVPVHHRRRSAHPAAAEAAPDLSYKNITTCKRVIFKLGTRYTGLLCMRAAPTATTEGTALWHQSTTLHWPRASSDFHQHAFAVCALAAWNNIPASICDSGTLGTFRPALKTHLFNYAYTSCHWQPSIGVTDSLLRDLWRQPKKYLWLIDWLTVKPSWVPAGIGKGERIRSMLPFRFSLEWDQNVMCGMLLECCKNI